MTDLATDTLRTVGPADAIPNDFVVPYYLDDRKRRISVARVDDRLYAFDDLCTCAEQTCPLSGDLLTGTMLMCQCHGSRSLTWRDARCVADRQTRDRPPIPAIPRKTFSDSSSQQPDHDPRDDAYLDTGR